MRDIEIQFYLLSFAKRRVRFQILEDYGVDSRDLSMSLRLLADRGLLSYDGGRYSLNQAGLLELHRLAKRLGKRGSTFFMPAHVNDRIDKPQAYSVLVPETRRYRFWYGRG